MNLTTQELDHDIGVVVVDGELNAVASDALRQRFRATITADRPNVIVDLTAVVFMDSSGLGALVAGLKLARSLGGQLVLVGLQDQVKIIFQITMAYRIFDVLATQAAAVAFLIEAGPKADGPLPGP